MRTLPIAAATALSLIAVTASAQTTQPRSTTTPAPTATQAPAPQPVINPLTKEAVSGIDGTAVYGNDNDKIGHVSDLLMDPQTKKIDRLVVTAGGVLGLGGHDVAIPIDQFQWDANKGGFKLSVTTAQLKEMPAYVQDDKPMTGSSTSANPRPSDNAGNSEK